MATKYRDNKLSTIVLYAIDRENNFGHSIRSFYLARAYKLYNIMRHDSNIQSVAVNVI